MSTDATVSERPRDDSNEPSVPLLSKQDWILIAVVILAQLPLLAIHFQNLWRYPHYQYFPVVLAGFIWLLWTRRPVLGQSEFVKRPMLEGVSLILGIGFLVVALIGFSPWLAAIAAVFIAGHLMLRFSTTDPICNFLGIWALLWLLVPIPLGFDIDLIQWLQWVTSRVASKVLDLMSVNHLMAGNVVELPTQKLFVDEACSGIQSFFALLACTALYVVWNYRTILHAWLLLASTLVWCVVMNVARVVTIAAFNDDVQVDLAEGWGHEALGLAIFAVTLILMASTDNMLAFLLGPIGTPPPGKPNRYNWNPLNRLWNVVIARQAIISEEDETATVETNSNANTHQKPHEMPRLVWLAGIALFAFVGVTQTVLIAQHASRNITAERMETPASEHALSLEAEDLPEELQGWKRLDFRSEKRSMGSIYGEHSRTWTYAGVVKSGESATQQRQFLTVVSLDFPFENRHDLTKCYRGRGWTIDKIKTVSRENEDDYVLFELVNPFEERGMVMYSHFNAAGQSFTAGTGKKGDLAKRAIRRADGKLVDADPGEQSLAFYQVQVFVPTLFELSSAEISEIEKRFFEARRQLKKNVQAESAESDSATTAGEGA